jgi:mRNA interferase HigB
VKVISRRTLKRSALSLKGSKDYKTVKSALDAWFYEALHADWKSPKDVAKAYAGVIARNGRIVFSLAANLYRLVVAVNYKHGIVVIKWIGSREEYHSIDV